MPPRVRILAVVSSHDAFARLADGAVVLRDRAGVSVVLQSASSIQDLAKDAAGDGGAIVATDLPAPPRPPRSRPRARSRRKTALRLLRNERPHVPVVVFLARWDSGLITTLRRLDIREVDPLGEEDPSRAIPIVLAEEVLPRSAVEFLRAVPEQLRSGHRLALARGVMRPEASWGEEDLARWAGVDLGRLRADFRRVGAGPPEEWRLWAHLYQLAERVEWDGEAVVGAARKLGISDPAALLEDCRPLVGGDPSTILRRAGASEVLRRLRRWCSPGGPPPRETERVVGIGRGPGRGVTSPALLGSTDFEERAARVEELYRKFADDIRRGAKAGGASDEDADDIVQDVFQSLLEGGSDLREREFSRAYFRRSGYNRALGLLKKVRVRARAVSNPGIHSWSGAASAEPERARSSWPEGLREVIRRLPEPHRAVVRLCDLETWRVREVAELLGMSEKSVEHRRARARRRIREDLKR